MGMFDYIHYGGFKYQTKDTPSQFIDDYKIEVDQESGLVYLWLKEYDSEWVDIEDNVVGGYFKRNNERWVKCEDFDGSIRFYREDEKNGGYKNDAWIEFKALFSDGQLIKMVGNSYEPDDGALTEEQTNQILKEVKETKRCETNLKSSIFGLSPNKSN
jgi:hypothetical protein